MMRLTMGMPKSLQLTILIILLSGLPSFSKAVTEKQTHELTEPRSSLSLSTIPSVSSILGVTATDIRGGANNNNPHKKNYRSRNTSGPIEYNPNYSPSPYEEERYYHQQQQQQQQQQRYQQESVHINAYNNPRQKQTIFETHDNKHNDFFHQHHQQQLFTQNHLPSSSQPPPLTKLLQSFLHNLKRQSPTMYYTFISSTIIFLLWQIQSPSTIVLSNLLKENFVCSRRNTIHHKRIYTLLTSAVSHTTFTHLAMNLYGFHMFGSSVRSILQSTHSSHHRNAQLGVQRRTNMIPLWVFCLGAAIFSNTFFLFNQPHGSCIGLSGVVLALLALDAKVYPNKSIGFVVRFVPIRLPAQYALTCFLAASALGAILGSNDGIAHAVHLGGLIYGILWYELMTKRGGLSVESFGGMVRDVRYECRKLMFKMKKRLNLLSSSRRTSHYA